MGSNTCPRPRPGALTRHCSERVHILSSHCYPCGHFLANQSLLSAQPRWERQAAGTRSVCRSQHCPCPLSPLQIRHSAAAVRFVQKPRPLGPLGSPLASAGRQAGSHTTSGAAGGVGRLSTLGQHGRIMTHVSSGPGSRGTTHKFWDTDKTDFCKGAAQQSSESGSPPSDRWLTSQGPQGVPLVQLVLPLGT